MSNLPLNIDVQQILLHMLNFVILAGGLYLILYKPVKNFMDQRTEYYKKMDDDANAALERAKETETAYQEKLSHADEEIAEMKSRFAKEVADSSREKEERATKEAEKIVTDARAKAKDEHDRMIRDARQEIAQLAADAAMKLVESGNDEYEQFIRAAGKGDVHED